MLSLPAPACVLLPTALGWDVAQCQQCWALGLAREGQRVVWRQRMQGEEVWHA